MATTTYGRDTFCTDDIEPGRQVTGVLLVAQAAYRRITTPRGALLGCPNYGIDIRELLGEAVTTAGLAAIPGTVRAELLKDDRIESCTVRASYSGGPNGTLTLEIEGECGEGPFELVVSISELKLELLKIGAR